MKKISTTVVMCLLPLWWIWTLVWQFGFIQFVARIAYIFSPPNVRPSLLAMSLERAYHLATQVRIEATDLLFTPSEVSHLLDVSAVYALIQRFMSILAIVSWSLLLLFVAKKQDFSDELHTAKKVYGILSLSIIPLSLVFDTFFTIFHQLLFPQGNWQFPENSLLIQVFPEVFWKLMLLSINTFFVLFFFLFWFLTMKKKQ